MVGVGDIWGILVGVNVDARVEVRRRDTVTLEWRFAVRLVVSANVAVEVGATRRETVVDATCARDIVVVTYTEIVAFNKWLRVREAAAV